MSVYLQILAAFTIVPLAGMVLGGLVIAFWLGVIWLFDRVTGLI